MTDLDGTIFDDYGNANDEDLEALKRAADAGIKIVPVTARTTTLGEVFIERFTMAEYVVYCNGALIYNRKQNKCIYRDEVKRDTIKALYEYLRTVVCIPSVTLDGVSYIDKEILDRSLSQVPLPRGYDKLIEYSVITDVFDVIGDEDKHVDVMYIAYPDMESKAAAEKEILKIDDLSTLGSVPTEQIISNSTATKENVILKSKEIFGIDRSGIMSFGDGDNDYGMLKYAGAGVAMANAMPMAKEAAQYMTLSIHECGVAHMINKLLDGGLPGFTVPGRKTV